MTRKKTPKDVPLPPVPQRNTGYYPTPMGRLRSVTTIINGGVPKPALVPWAARTVAETAVEHAPFLSRLRGQIAREEAIEWLKGAADRQRDGAGELGSAIHRHANARVLGEPRPTPTDEQVPFLRALDNWLDDFRPSFECCELVVANPEDGWAGTLDFCAYLRGFGLAMVLGDYKSGGGIWGEVGLQLAAYQRGTVGWLTDGREIEPPKAERAVVVHLRPSKYPESEGGRGYAMYPVDTSDEMYQVFRDAQRVDAGRALMRKAVGDALDIPTLPDLPDLPDPTRKAS